MDRRDFLRLSGTVTAGFTVAPLDVFKGIAVASTTAFFVFTLEWSKDRPHQRVPCDETACASPDLVAHNHYKLNLTRHRVDAFDAEDAKARVRAVIADGRTLGDPIKI